jgi:hypothetical protein
MVISGHISQERGERRRDVVSACAQPWLAMKKGPQVATVKPSAWDLMKLAAQMQSGQMPAISAHVNKARAETPSPT